MLTEKFYKVLDHEGVVSIVSWTEEEAHVTCTWNSFIEVTEDERILIPAAGMKSTEADIEKNNTIKLALGSRDVLGNNNYQWTGFEIVGAAAFLTEGSDYEMMKEKYPFLSRVLEVKVSSAKQLL